ncbi:MAG: thioredoxin family protein [Candidatus Peribacteraceae bacterium]|nr:thioredoxin family protein [Candidatus Peribacteraceae bacterium]
MVLINDNSTTLNIGDAMPDFSLPATDDSLVDSGSINAQVMAIIFTCNHCPYAKAYEDRLAELGHQFKNKSVQCVLINSNDAVAYPDDSFEEMKKLAENKAFPFPYCFDETQEIAKAYGALCTPHCFVFDRQRTLQYKGRIDDSWKDVSQVKERNLFDAIDALVQGKTPPKSEVNAIGCSIKWRK